MKAKENNTSLTPENKEGKAHSFFHSLFYKTVVVRENEDGTPIQTIEKKRSLVLLWVLLFFVIFGLCFIFIPIPNKIQLNKLGDIVSQLFVPSKWSLKTKQAWWDYLFKTAFPKIWSTVEMVFIATVVGAILAVPFYILASSNIVKNKFVNQLVRFIVNIIRTLPTYVLAILGAIFYGYSETAGIFAMSLFTFGIIFKLMYEYIETCDMNPFEVCMSNGANKLQAYSLSLHPQVNPMYVSNFIYTFEINIRASVVLGFVGAGGIGQLLSDAMESTQYDKIGAILVPLLIVVFSLQVLSTYLRRKIS